MHNQLTEQGCYWMMINWACDRNTSVNLDQEKLRVSNTKKLGIEQYWRNLCF